MQLAHAVPCPASAPVHRWLPVVLLTRCTRDPSHRQSQRGRERGRRRKSRQTRNSSTMRTMNRQRTRRPPSRLRRRASLLRRRAKVRPAAGCTPPAGRRLLAEKATLGLHDCHVALARPTSAETRTTAIYDRPHATSHMRGRASPLATVAHFSDSYLFHVRPHLFLCCIAACAPACLFP